MGLQDDCCVTSATVLAAVRDLGSRPDDDIGPQRRTKTRCQRLGPFWQRNSEPCVSFCRNQRFQPRPDSRLISLKLP
eukprot:1123994-Heterocapsa_arctica.AAC.1